MILYSIILYLFCLLYIDKLFKMKNGCELVMKSFIYKIFIILVILIGHNLFGKGNLKIYEKIRHN